MQVAQTLDGSGLIQKKFQVGAAVAAATPVKAGAIEDAGCVPIAQVGGAPLLLGIALDDAAYQTAQNADGSDPAGFATVIINPSAVFRARLSGSATSGTALSPAVVDTPSTDGLTVDASATNFLSPNTDGGFIFGYTGANSGHARKMTTVADGVATVTVAFPKDTANGDTFLWGGPPMGGSYVGGVELTTDLLEVEATGPYGAGNINFRIVELDLKDSSEDGVNTSYALMYAVNHYFGAIGGA